MRVGSLFSGIGGLDLGLERAGMEIVWQVENNPFCQKVLKKYWPEVPCYGNIKEIDFTTLPTVDLICGGFPCQPYSIAGKYAGENDERNLWPETIRAIRQTAPGWVLLENVPNLLTYEYFGRIIGELSQNGYVVEWNIVPASAFGFLHKRERLFIIAYSKNLGRPDSKHGQGETDLKGNIMASVQFEGSDISDPLTEFQTKVCTAEFVRGINGIPHRVDRLKSLGNAVVPKVAEWIGKRIMEAMDA